MNEPALLPGVLSQIAALTGAAMVQLLLTREETGETLIRSCSGEAVDAAVGDRLEHAARRGGLTMTLAAVRTANDTPFSSDAVGDFDRLAPFLERALMLAARLHLGPAPAPSAMSVIMASARPLALLRADSGELLVNSAAAACGLTAEKVVQAAGGSNEFKGLCRAALRAGSWTIRVDQGGSAIYWRLRWQAGQEGGMIIDLDAPRTDEGVRFDLFSQTHGLTRAERDVLERVAAGLSADEIASDRQSSRETVRVQLRSIREKTNCVSRLAMTAAVTAFHVE